MLSRNTNRRRGIDHSLIRHSFTTKRDLTISPSLTVSFRRCRPPLGTIPIPMERYGRRMRAAAADTLVKSLSSVRAGSIVHLAGRHAGGARMQEAVAQLTISVLDRARHR